MHIPARSLTRRQQWDLARRTSSEWSSTLVTDSTDTDTDTYTDTDTSTKTKSPTPDPSGETDADSGSLPTGAGDADSGSLPTGAGDADSGSLPTGAGDADVHAYYGIASVELIVCDDDGVLADPLGNKCVCIAGVQLFMPTGVYLKIHSSLNCHLSVH